MSTNFTKFGVVAGVSPDVQAFVESSINQATQDLVTQQGTSQIGAVPQYTNTSGKTVQATPYTLPTTVGVDGQTLVVSGGSLVYGAGGGTPTFLTNLTVQNLSQGTSALLQNYVLPTTIPPNDNLTYTLTAQNLQANPIGGISLLAVTTFRFQAFDANLLNPFFIEYVINNGYYSINDFLLRNQQLMDLAIGRQTSIIFNAQFTYDTPTQKFGFAIGVQSQNFGRLLSISGFNGHVVLGGQALGDEPFFPFTAPPQYYPNATPNLVFGTDNILKWKVAPFTQNSIISNDGSASVICEDVGIGGNLISSNANWNMGLGDLNNVGSISSTAETLTSTCGQSQLQLASIADGTSQSNTTYLSSGSGSMNTAFATTVGEALIVRDGGAGTVIRVNVGAETILKNAPDRECIRVYDYGVQIKGEGQPLATGVRCAINLDGDIFFNREDPIFGLKEIFLTQGTNTRIWSPSTISEVDIDESYIKLKRSNVEKLKVDDTGTKISQSYYLPTADGTIGQVMTTDGLGQASWQTPQILGFYSQTTPVTVASTAVQTSIIGAGVGTLTVPANYFTTGMSFTYRTGGLFGALNNATIRFRLTNSGTLFDSGLLQFSPAIASGRPWNIDVTFIYIGGTTMITNFNFQYNNGSDARGFTAQNTNNTFNPAIVNTLDFTAQWGASSASNTITTNYGVLTKIY